ncbi:MAG: alkaline phosphatase family protein, partial [Planctomycetota bacterium]
MPNAVAVLNVVGLSSSLLPHAPRISTLDEHATLTPVLPAVTCSVQSSMLTGQPVSSHGIVGNGWFNHEQQEVQFWKQSNKLVAGEKVWETARQRDPSCTCLNMFWWYNMYSTADWSVTPRPQYKADGRKVPDCYSHPAGLRDELQSMLG